MKKIIYVLCLSLLVCLACSKDEQNLEEQTINDFARNSPEKDKIKLCHYDYENGTWKIINSSNKSLDGHLKHGDVLLIDADGDGYVGELNECLPGGDCDDNDPSKHPGIEVFNFSSVYNPVTGKTWMDRNLGASHIATSSTDAASYGDLYQWGRSADGHEVRTSSTTTTLSNTDAPDHSNFILSTVPPLDWRSPQNFNLWQGVNGVNNPCPCGFRIPTRAELDAERASWSSNNTAGAFASPLKLPMGGHRNNYYGSLFKFDTEGNYWSSTIENGASVVLNIENDRSWTTVNFQSIGFSVRCIKD